MCFEFWVPLNVAVNPLHAETWMSLPDIHFQKGPLPNTEFPACAKCSGKGSRSWWSSQNMNQAVRHHGASWHGFRKALSQLEKWCHYKL